MVAVGQFLGGAATGTSRRPTNDIFHGRIDDETEST